MSSRPAPTGLVQPIVWPPYGWMPYVIADQHQR